MKHEIKVMSFNMRCNVASDGANCFDCRRNKILDVLNRENPDVIGFQEITPDMLIWLENVLGGRYTVLGHGRDKDYGGEANPIAYRTSRFSLHSYSMGWLSKTPEIPGSRLTDADQSGCPRIYCYAELIDRVAHTKFAFINTHTDHKGAMARMFECNMLMELIRSKGVPFAMVGDFNDFPHTEPIKLILDTHDELGTCDATKLIKGSFHHFSMERILQNNKKIDYIFTNLPHDPARSYAVADDDSCGHFYSDHLALCAYLTLNNND